MKLGLLSLEKTGLISPVFLMEENIGIIIGQSNDVLKIECFSKSKGPNSKTSTSEDPFELPYQKSRKK
ncbi:hypothetical protein D0X99_09060 [Algoriphagus lacus]|uniref:Uncharacterized protein n=1 Tax=Algoriphagus lacus TaxID=2056311 RepID=A0A418PRT3_9BACT|nr:hypothetical protein D0X99_09060 [Algoriphagus lacus]